MPKRHLLCLSSLRCCGAFLLFFLFTCSAWALPAEAPAHKPAGPRDTLTFENGDTLSGKLNREVSGSVSFQSDELGEVNVPWSKIKSLHTQNGYVVLENKPGVHIRHFVADVARGTLSVSGGAIQVNPGATPPAAHAGGPGGGEAAVAAAKPIPVARPIPVKEAQYILDERTFDRQVRHEPNFFEGWNGSATAGVTVVQGTENQYAYTSAVSLARSVPTVSWLATRNRMLADFSSSYGKITQPAYYSDGALIPTTYTKSSIFHADAERDEYASNRLYVLAQTAFDHNYSQGLDLQQIYGAGAGVTAVKRGSQQLDLKATLQYESQGFITSASGTDQNLVGSTLSGTYALKLPRGIDLNQEIAYVPAFNVTRAYSANETNTLTFPFYKNVAFTVGSIDSYLNDPVPAVPPTTRNSFQFTTGITYTVKSKY